MIRTIGMMVAAAALVSALALALALAPALAAAAAAGDRAVTVTVDNNVTSVEEHTQTVYRITVRNNSAVDYPSAFIAQMLPGALAFGESQPVPSKVTENTLGSAGNSEVQWTRHLPAFGEVTIDLTAAIGERPDSGTLSTTACVMPDGVTRPLICDTDADSVGSQFSFAWLFFGLVSAGGLGVLAVWLWRRRATQLRAKQGTSSNERDPASAPASAAR
ncbi:MAG TPA: hypothetical protein VF062_15700 [Candidatus Limnocylindrales bacterium]